MTTVRTPRHRPPRVRVTPEALGAFVAGDRIALHRCIGLKPWEHSPLDVDDGPCPDWVRPEDWERAQALRAELLAAGGA